jgi:hypothetical protein
MSSFERAYGREPDATKVNRSMPLSRVKKDHQEFIEGVITSAIPNIEESGRLKRGEWDKGLNTLCIKDINELEYAQIDEELRKHIREENLDPSIPSHNQLIRQLRWDIHELWRKDGAPMPQDATEWLKES